MTTTSSARENARDDDDRTGARSKLARPTGESEPHESQQLRAVPVTHERTNEPTNQSADLRPVIRTA
jgi:hypothetical protein